MHMQTLPSTFIRLKPKEDHRIRDGHPWVFSNEIATVTGSPQAGDVVPVLSSINTLLGIGFYQPRSLIAARMLSRNEESVDEIFFRKRLSRALELRTTLFPGSTVYRLAHGESDQLPGLIVDRYNEYLVVQTFSLGMDLRKRVIVDVLASLFQPAGIIERNESPLRELEQLPRQKGILFGTSGVTTVDDHGIKILLDPLEGQKTGAFLDQRENRLRVRRYAAGARVLDLFCNDGGFALHAAAGGAREVIAIDSAADAIRRANANVALNHITTVRFMEQDVFEALTALRGEEASFDVVILDPPSFTRTKKNVQTAKRGYRELHMGAMHLLRRGGYLCTASCSHHILPEVFEEIVADSARGAGRTLQLLEWRGASPDHPLIPGVPETGYLKFGIFRVH
jgi:23S rRNA (cytosine1962-C5)-methyltransferase